MNIEYQMRIQAAELESGSQIGFINGRSGAQRLESGAKKIHSVG